MGWPARSHPHCDGLLSASAAPHRQLVVAHQPPHAVLQVPVGPPPLVGMGEGQLVGSAPQVGVEHMWVRRVDHRRLRLPLLELLGVADQPPVELVVAGDQDGHRGGS